MKQSKKIALGLSALALFLIAISFLHDPLSGSGTVTRKVLLESKKKTYDVPFREGEKVDLCDTTCTQTVRIRKVMYSQYKPGDIAWIFARTKSTLETLPHGNDWIVVADNPYGRDTMTLETNADGEDYYCCFYRKVRIK